MLRQLALWGSVLGSLSHAWPTADLPLSSPVEAERIPIDPRQNKYWVPPMKSSIQFILTGIPDVDEGFIKPETGIYELDMFWTPDETIAKLKELGQRSVCYFSAATAESWRDDYKQFQKQDLGKELPDWPGEKYLDIRRDNVFKVIKARIDLAAKKGCDSIEPDNVGVFAPFRLVVDLIIAYFAILTHDSQMCTRTTTVSNPKSPLTTPSPTSTRSRPTPAAKACPSA